MTLAYAYRYFDRVRRRAWKPGVYMEFEYGFADKCFLFTSVRKDCAVARTIELNDAVATDWEEYYDEAQEGGTL